MIVKSSMSLEVTTSKACQVVLMEVYLSSHQLLADDNEDPHKI